MKIIDVIQGSEEWLDYRKGKISGTMLGDLYSKRGGRKIGFYQIIAERLAIDPDDENRMDRGLRLEEEALVDYVLLTGKDVERVGICVHDKYPEIINSPDGLIADPQTQDLAGVSISGKTVYTEAVEIKCLSSARHLQAVIENVVPDEFEAQKLQYFIVNPKLQKLHFIFFDPRVKSVPMHVITVTREELGNLPEFYLKFQLDQLAEMNQIVERLAF